MPFVPHVDGYLAQITLECDHCGEEVIGAAGLPGAQRSIRELLEMSDALRSDGDGENRPQCPECESEEPAFTLQRISYQFEEGPVLEIHEDVMTISGEPVESEEDIMAAIGRPFSVVDWHRLQLTPAFAGACVYPVEAGQVVVAMRLTDGDRTAIEREDDAAIQQLSERLLTAAVPALQAQEIDSEDVQVVLWSGSQQAGVQRWLGPRSQDLIDGQLMVATVFDSERVIEAFTHAFARIAPELEFDGDAACVRHRELEEIEMPDLQLGAHGAICVADGMTLAEAASQLTFRVQQTFACALALHSSAEQAGKDLTWAPGLQATIAGDDVTRTFDVGGLAAQLSFDTEAFAESVTRDMSDPAAACDCEQVNGLIVRPVEAGPGGGRILTDGVAAFPVLDCKHFTVYSPDEAIDPDDDGWWEERLKSARNMSFRAYCGALPASHGLLVAAHNVSSIFAQPALGAGLLAAVKGSFTPTPGRTPVAIAVSVDIVLLLADPDTDQALLQAEMLQYRRMLEQSPFAMAAPLPSLALGLPDADPAGEWDITPLNV